MRIAMLASVPFPPREGIGFYVWNLSRYLTKQGHKVHVITRGGLKASKSREMDGITLWRPSFAPVYPIHVHFHSLFVDHILRQLESELDLIHLHTPLVRYPKTGLPTLVTVHTPMKADTGSIRVNDYLGLLVKLQAPVSIQIEKEIFSRVNRIIAVAESVAKELEFYSIDSTKVVVLGNGVDTDIFTPANGKQNIVTNYFLTAGRLGPRKGLMDLIQCASSVVKHFPDIRFYIAGSGPFESRLHKEVQQLKLTKKINFLGHVTSRDQLIDLYRGATAYIHPAHYEGLPTVLLEAMACGRPVVATAVSGALDVIQDGHNGILTPPHAPEVMAQAIFRLLDDPQLGERLGVAARTTVKQKYSWQIIANKYLNQYHKLVGNANR